MCVCVWQMYSPLPAGSDYVSAEIVDKVPRETRKRQEAIFELVSSEKSYVGSLNLVKEVSQLLAGVAGHTHCGPSL